jgi:hypothetical protein
MTLPVLSSGDDHYFHFKFASGLLEHGFWDSFRHFKTIYFSNIAQGAHFLYYNFLFYAVLIPFTYVAPLYLGIKLYAILILSLIGTIFYILFRKLHVQYPFLWSAAFFVVLGVGSFLRLFLSRPFVFSPVILLLFTVALYKRKYLWIILLACIPLFWHTATFFIPVLIAVVYGFCHLFYYKKFPWKEVLYTVLGTVLAIGITLCIDHGFFISIKENLFDVLGGVLHTKVGAPNISVGNEVYPKNFFDFINQNILLAGMFIIATVFYVRVFWQDIKKRHSFIAPLKDKKMLHMVLFVVSCVFITAIPLISNRFTDLFIFFGWLFIALIFTEIFFHISYKELVVKKYILSALTVFLLYFFVNNFLQLYDSFATYGSRPVQFSSIGIYLDQNLEPGEVVFDADWSWFPQLYYYAPRQNYVIALEPMLMYKYNPRLYWLWQNMGGGIVCDKARCPDLEKNFDTQLSNKKTADAFIVSSSNALADTFTQDFKTRYVVSSRNLGRLNYILDKSKHFKKVISTDDTYFLYKVVQ